MAGLTKAQRAERAAQAEEAPSTPDDGLVVMTKGDDELAVHPTCVEAHKRAGWLVKPD